MKVEPWVNRLLEQFGKNPYGRKLYRIVWSEDVFVWEYGKQNKKYGEGKDRWLLEKWLPPEAYDRASWEAEVLRDDNGLIIISPQGEIQYVLGPFPEHGDYEHCYTFEGVDGQYCPVEVSIMELLIKCIEAGKMMTQWERVAALKAKQERQEKEADRVFDDVWQDAAPAPGAKLPDRYERLTSFDIQKQLEDATKGMPDGFAQISEKQAQKLIN